MRIFATITVLSIFVIATFLVAGRARAWPRGAWDAADHNHDGILTRLEMQRFGQQKSHRNGPRLMMHFDAADTNHDQIVDVEEVTKYGTAIGSKDPIDHLPPGQALDQVNHSFAGNKKQVQ